MKDTIPTINKNANQWQERIFLILMVNARLYLYNDESLLYILKHQRINIILI